MCHKNINNTYYNRKGFFWAKLLETTVAGSVWLPNLSYPGDALKILSHLPSIYLCSLSFVYVLYSPWVSNRDVLLEKLLFGWRLPLDASDEDVLLSLFLSKKCSFTKLFLHYFEIIHCMFFSWLDFLCIMSCRLY